MIKTKKIKAGNKYVDAVLIKLLSRNLILLRGSKGYICCGYLNLSVAQKCKDVAAKITGISSIEEAIATKVAAVSRPAAKLGIYKGQKVKDALKIIA